MRHVVVGIEHDLQVLRREALEKPGELPCVLSTFLTLPRARGSRRCARRGDELRDRVVEHRRMSPASSCPANRSSRPRDFSFRSRSRRPTCRAGRELEAAREEVDVRAARLRRPGRRGCGSRRARRSRFPQPRAGIELGDAPGVVEALLEHRPPSCTVRRPKRPHVSSSAVPLAAAKSYVKIPSRGQAGVARARVGPSRANERSRATSSAGAGRSLEHDPAVVADLVERSSALGEVHRPRPGGESPAVTRACLEVNAAHERSERANLRGGVHAAHDDVREVEVAAECWRADAPASAWIPSAGSVPS